MTEAITPGGGPDGEDDEVEPVELLVQLAEEGKIEPWDIDIVEVTDAFLAKLDAADLRTSGRALFYASVLLRMKSDELVLEDEPEEEEAFVEEEWPAMEPEGPFEDPIAGLEREMERRLDRKHARGSPRTLDQLVRELRDAERGSWWKSSREYDTSGSPKGFQRGTQTLDYHSGDDFRLDDEPREQDVIGTAHGEEIEEVIEVIAEHLHRQYEAGRPEVLFREIDGVGPTRIESFLAVLFLAHRGTVRLEQDELFGDLWVQEASAFEEDPGSVAVPGP